MAKRKDQDKPPPQRPSVITPKTVVVAIDGCVSISKTFIKAVCWTAVAFMMWMIARELSGKATTLQANLGAIFSASLDRYAYIVIMAMMGFAWRRQNKLREKTVTDLKDYVKELELRFDPQRSSSKLTDTGKPRKEDLDAVQ